MAFPAVSGPVSEEDVERHLIKLTKRLIKDLTKEYGYILEHVGVVKERRALLIHYNELRNDLQNIIYNIKCAMGRLAEENFIQNTLKIVVGEIENIGYLVIHPSLTFNTETLLCIINKTMNTMHTNFLLLVDLTESQDLSGDTKTRREIMAILNDFLLVMERTKLHCPSVNIYDEEVMIGVSRTESIKQINFVEEYQKKFFFETIHVAIHSLRDIIDHFHRSLYAYNHTTREFLMYCAVKLNTGLVDLEKHLQVVVKSDDDMYGSLKEEVLKFFGNCSSVYEWIVDTSNRSNLKCEAGQEGAIQEEDEITLEKESEALALEKVDQASIEDQKIIEALVFAKPRDAKEMSQEDELIKSLKGKCVLRDVHSNFEDLDSFSFHELQRRLTSDYVLLSRRFIREINVLFGIVNKMCFKKMRFNKRNCDCEICKGEM